MCMHMHAFKHNYWYLDLRLCKCKGHFSRSVLGITWDSGSVYVGTAMELEEISGKSEYCIPLTSPSPIPQSFLPLLGHILKYRPHSHSFHCFISSSTFTHFLLASSRIHSCTHTHTLNTLPPPSPSDPHLQSLPRHQFSFCRPGQQIMEELEKEQEMEEN